MNVRRLMLTGIALAFGLVLAQQVAVDALERKIEHIDAVQLAVGKVSRDAAGLLVLTQDYLLHGSARARQQWNATQADLSQTLRSLDGPAVGLQDDIVGLQAVNNRLPLLFGALDAVAEAETEAGDADAKAEAEDARRQMLSDHLVAQTRRISDGAFDLAGRLIELHERQQRQLRMVTLAASASFAALLTGLVAIVLRRVLRPMRRLQDTARCIEGGDLHARCAYPTPDEFGALSQSFDAMTEALQDRQAALEATRRDLRTVLDAVPSMIGYWDRQLDNRVANQAYQASFGADAPSLPGRNLRDLLEPALFEADRPFIEAALRGEPQTFERAIPRLDGPGLRHALAHYLPDRQDEEVKGFYVVMHDVSDLNEGRRLLAAALSENEALLAAIQTYALFSEMGPDGRFINVNDNVCRLSGFTREELIGQPYAIHQPVLAEGDFDTAIWPTLMAGRAWQGEFGCSTKDGSPYWTYAVMAPVKADNGTVVKYVSIRTDITAQRQLAQDVQRSNERFELAAGTAGIGVWDYDIGAGTLVWDDSMYGLYGRQRSDGVEPYTLWSESLHPEDKAGTEQALQDAIAGRADFEPQFRIVRPDGEVRTLKAMTRVVRDAEGRPQRMIGVNFDVTERLRTEAALQANESLLRRVGRMAHVGGWRVDIGSAKLQWSEQTRAIHEVPSDFEPTVASAIDFYAPESRHLIAGALDRALSHGQAWDLELRLLTFTGRSVWVRAMGEVEFDADGRPAHLVGAFQDLTERRRTEILLRAATTAAEAASAAKSVFLANMSHEIRTPLNAVLGVNHLLAGTPLDADQRRLLGQAQLAGTSLLGIVNDVLDLAKIEAGEMALDEVPYEPALLLRELVMLYAPRAVAKGLEFVHETADDVPGLLIGDRGRLQQILTNLIANAIKFTEQGAVRVFLSVADRGERQCRLKAEVQDTGIGIAADVQGQLFAPFVQADSSTTRRFGGSGLGLSIVKRLATIMGGEVGLDSQPGAGSTFRVTLPQRVPSEDELGSLQAPAGTLDLLVVDDSSIDRLSMATQVRALGWQALALDSGAALVQEVEQRLATGRPLPDALLVDWRMPGMDGLQALAALARVVGRERLPAALLVSSAERHQLLGADHEHLADDVLPKPLSASMLFNAVNHSLARRLGTTDRVLQSTRLDAPETMWLAGMRVLLVDDSDINLDVARQLLERRGAEVRPCSDAQSALDLLRAAPQDFDAVLMDVQMPEMDGLEATRLLRQYLGLADLPVIALTAGALMEERRRATDAGMTDFLTKPVDPVLLVRCLRRAVEAYRGVALPVGEVHPAQAVGGEWPAVEGIDAQDVAARLGHDAALFRTMLARLLKDFGDLAQPALPDADDPAAHRDLLARVHKLRGSAGTLGAREVQRRAGEVEAGLRESAQLDAQALDGLAQALARLARASQPALQAPPPPPPPAPAEGLGAQPPATDAEIATLTDLLTRQDLAACDCLQALLPGLRQRLGLKATEQLKQCVDGLDFEHALGLLLPAVSPAG